MSRVAAIIIVGLCCLVGCSKPTQSPKVTAAAVCKPKIYKTKNVVITDPNQVIALEQALEKIQPLENQYYIIPVQPQTNVDYKIIASKPDPNIDYKILNPMQTNHERLMQKLKERQDTEAHNKIYEFRPQPPDPNR